MHKIGKRPSVFTVVSVTLLVSVLASMPYRPSLAAGAGAIEYRLLKRLRQSDEPVQISNMTVRGNHVKLGTAFLEDSDWIQNMSFDVTNISQKTITYLSIETAPEDLGDTILTLGRLGNATFMYGVAPEDVLKPGEKIHFDFDQEDYKARFPTMSDRAKTALEDPGEVSIRVATAVFEDDTMWRNGKFLVRDPNNHDRWCVVQPRR